MNLGEALGITDHDTASPLGNYFAERSLAAGEVLCRRGDPSDALYILLEGRVSVILPLVGAGYAKRLRSYGPGTIVGEMGFYGNAPRSADVTADGATRMARLDHEASAGSRPTIPNSRPASIDS